MYRFFTAILFLMPVMMLTGCGDDIISWKEEVKLSTGKIIVVEQKRRCVIANTGGRSSHCLPRDAWLTMNLAEYSEKPIEWHENLVPMVLNVHNGKLYLVAYPPSSIEYKKYGGGIHPYFPFMWDGQSWKRIPFSEVPSAIYDANMVLNSPPLSQKTYIDWQTKVAVEIRAGQILLRIDPEYHIDNY